MRIGSPTIQALAVIIVLTWSHFVVAQNTNKVVVIPLGDSKSAASLQRQIIFSGPSLGANSSTTASALGIGFPNSGVPAAFLIMERPADWDGESAVVFTLFTQGTSTGTERFFIRPRDFNTGDTFQDELGINTNTVNYSQSNQFRELSVTVLAATLQKDWWQIVFQRDNSSGTNTGTIVLQAVSVSYAAEH